MVEEQKKECCKVAGGLKVIFKMLIGIVLIALGVFLCIRWLSPFVELIKGCLGPLVILVGLVFLAIAKE